MFLFALLELSSCETKMLCLKSESTWICPEAIVADSTYSTAADLQAKLVKGNSYIIFTDTPFELTQQQLLDVKAIHSIKTSIVTIEAKIIASAHHSGIGLSRTTLDFQKATSAKLLESDPKIHFTEVVFDIFGSFKAGSLVTIQNLNCKSFKSAIDGLAFMSATDALIYITGGNIIDKVKGAGTGIVLTESTNNFDLKEGGPNVVLVNQVNKDVDLTFEGDCSGLKVKVNITLVHHFNNAKAVITLKEKDFIKPPSPIVTVKAYYKKDPTFKENGEAACILNPDFLVDADGKRKVPIAQGYCLDIENRRSVFCPNNAVLLWDSEEVVRTRNGENLVTIYLSSFDARGANLNLKDYQNRNILFNGSLPGKKQIISMNMEKKDENFIGNFQFSSISLVVTVP